MHNLFVYGSLKRGFNNHNLLEKQEYVGLFVTLDPIYKMENLGKYPGVTKHGQQYIQGELYRVDDPCLMQLDILEENGKTYQRELIKLANYSEPCWIYFLLDQHSSLFSKTKEVFQILTLPANDNSYHQIVTWKGVLG